MDGPLKNPRHEHFARLVAGGQRPSEAYVQVGFARAGAGSCASRLLKNRLIKTRLEELQQVISEAAVARASVDREFVIGGLKENYERAMRHQPVFDRLGNPTGEYVYQGSVANRALELIGKELGMFVDRSKVEMDVRDALDRSDPAQLAAYVAEMRAKKEAAERGKTEATAKAIN